MTAKFKYLCALVVVGGLGLIAGTLIAKKDSTTATTSSNLSSVASFEGQCGAITLKGTQCSRRAKYKGYCWQHRKDTVTTTSSSTISSSSFPQQCTAITKKGTRCSRNVKSGLYCWQHLQMNRGESSPTPPAVDKPQASNQCEAITKKGTRCKRKASQGKFCWQHAAIESSTQPVAPSFTKGEVLFVAENADNLTLGMPGEADYIINREGYAVGYDLEYKQPRWVSYCLTREEASAETANREGHTFRVDSLLPIETVTLDDYRYSGYDRGHLACAGDMRLSQTYMADSFFLSNVSPMNPSFNRGIWAILEKQVRGWAIEKEAIHIVTGPVFTVDVALPTIGENQITIPSAFYKVVYSEKPKQRAIGFLFPHEPLKENLPYEFACAVDAVEEQTGLDFFSELPDELENGVESICNVDDWFVDF